jgi:hypothetical protein
MSYRQIPHEQPTGYSKSQEDANRKKADEARAKEDAEYRKELEEKKEVDRKLQEWRERQARGRSVATTPEDYTTRERGPGKSLTELSGATSPIEETQEKIRQHNIEKKVEQEAITQKAIDIEKRAKQKRVREAAKQQIEAAREENKPTPYIQAKIEQLATDNGLTYDELIKEWNGKYNAEDNYELLKQKVAFKKGEISSYDVDELENAIKEEHESNKTPDEFNEEWLNSEEYKQQVIEQAKKGMWSREKLREVKVPEEQIDEILRDTPKPTTDRTEEETTKFYVQGEPPEYKKKRRKTQEEKNEENPEHLKREIEKEKSELKRLEEQDESNFTDFQKQIQGKDANIPLVKNHISYYEKKLKEQGEKSITNYSESPEDITYESSEESPKMKPSTPEKQEESEEQKRAKQEEKERKEQEKEEQRKRDYEQLMADQRKYAESFKKEAKSPETISQQKAKSADATLTSVQYQNIAEELPKQPTPGEDTEKMYELLEKKRLGKKYAATIKQAREKGPELGIPSIHKWKSPELLKREREEGERRAIQGSGGPDKTTFGSKHDRVITQKMFSEKKGEEKLTLGDIAQIKKKKEQEDVRQRYEAIQAEKRAEKYEKELEEKAKYGKLYGPEHAVSSAYGFIKGQKYRSGKSLKDLLGEVTSKIKVSGRSSNRRSNW